LEGKQHPDRDAQFRHINDTVSQAIAAGQPAISIDTKKKELVGEFENAGPTSATTTSSTAKTLNAGPVASSPNFKNLATRSHSKQLPPWRHSELDNLDCSELGPVPSRSPALEQRPPQSAFHPRSNTAYSASSPKTGADNP
jgi:Rhodopirellula transposase DDE domain